MMTLFSRTSGDYLRYTSLVQVITPSIWRMMVSVFVLHKQASSRDTEVNPFFGFRQRRWSCLCNGRSSFIVCHLYQGPGHCIAHLFSQTPDFYPKYSLLIRFSCCREDGEKSIAESSLTVKAARFS